MPKREQIIGSKDFQKLNSHILDAKGYACAVPPATRIILKSETVEIKTDLVITATSDEAKLNKTEKARLAYLRMLNLPWIGVQNMTLKLADDCRLTPDFNWIDENGRLVMEDVKGFQREDALIKMKVAARIFRMFRFIIVKKDGSTWEVKEVNP